MIESLEWNLEIQVDAIDVTPRTEPDPNWSYKDAQGHKHYWKIEKDEFGLLSGSLPTLNIVQDSPATDEYPATSHCECKICGAVIDPLFRVPHYVQTIPGRKTFKGFFHSTEILEKESLQEVCLKQGDGPAYQGTVKIVDIDIDRGFLYYFTGMNNLKMIL